MSCMSCSSCACRGRPWSVSCESVFLPSHPLWVPLQQVTCSRTAAVCKRYLRVVSVLLQHDSQPAAANHSLAVDKQFAVAVALGSAFVTQFGWLHTLPLLVDLAAGSVLTPDAAPPGARMYPPVSPWRLEVAARAPLPVTCTPHIRSALTVLLTRGATAAACGGGTTACRPAVDDAIVRYITALTGSEAIDVPVVAHPSRNPAAPRRPRLLLSGPVVAAGTPAVPLPPGRGQRSRTGPVYVQPSRPPATAFLQTDDIVGSSFPELAIAGSPIGTTSSPSPPAGATVALPLPHAVLVCCRPALVERVLQHFAQSPSGAFANAAVTRAVVTPCLPVPRWLVRAAGRTGMSWTAMDVACWRGHGAAIALLADMLPPPVALPSAVNPLALLACRATPSLYTSTAALPWFEPYLAALTAPPRAAAPVAVDSSNSGGGGAGDDGVTDVNVETAVTVVSAADALKALPGGGQRVSSPLSFALRHGNAALATALLALAPRHGTADDLCAVLAARCGLPLAVDALVEQLSPSSVVMACLLHTSTVPCWRTFPTSLSPHAITTAVAGSLPIASIMLSHYDDEVEVPYGGWLSQLLRRNGTTASGGNDHTSGGSDGVDAVAVPRMTITGPNTFLRHVLQRVSPPPPRDELVFVTADPASLSFVHQLAPPPPDDNTARLPVVFHAPTATRPLAAHVLAPSPSESPLVPSVVFGAAVARAVEFLHCEACVLACLRWLRVAVPAVSERVTVLQVALVNASSRSDVPLLTLMCRDRYYDALAAVAALLPGDGASPRLHLPRGPAPAAHMAFLDLRCAVAMRRLYANPAAFESDLGFALGVNDDEDIVLAPMVRAAWSGSSSLAVCWSSLLTCWLG